MHRAALTKSGFAQILREKHGIDLSVDQIPKGISKEKEMFLWAVDRFGPIPCANHSQCGIDLLSRKECHRDHIIGLRQVTEEQRKEYDQPWNQRYLCINCHNTKTFKRGLGGIWGSDSSRNAKIRRQEKKGQGCKTKSTQEKRWPKRWHQRLEGSRKIPSRPFRKDVKRPFPASRNTLRKAKEKE